MSLLSRLYYFFLFEELLHFIDMLNTSSGCMVFRLFYKFSD